jgi:hypothetical protein
VVLSVRSAGWSATRRSQSAAALVKKGQAAGIDEITQGKG